MLADAHVWTVILAAGEGARQRSHTADHRGATGQKRPSAPLRNRVPKADLLARASGVSRADRVIVVVAPVHARRPVASLRGLPPRNVLVQPANRGTATGILLALQRVLSSDPDASLVILPQADHAPYENAVGEGVAEALDLIGRDPSTAVLLGIEPDSADTGQTWVVPTANRKLAGVGSFVEKPDAATAHRLLDAEALWNSSILVAKGSTLLELFLRTEPALVSRMATASAATSPSFTRLSRLYAGLETVDFSKRVLVRCTDLLRVLRPGACARLDGSTTERIEACLRRSSSSRRAHARAASRRGAADLARAPMRARPDLRRRVHGRRPPIGMGRPRRIVR